MDIKIDFEGATPVLTLSGRLDSQGASVFDREASNIDKDTKHVVIDLSAVDYISSIGIRSLVKLEKSLRSRRGGIILIGVTSNVVQVLETSGVLKEFRSSDSLAGALKIVKQDAAIDEAATRYEINGRDYLVRRDPEGGSVLDLWGSFSDISDDDLAADRLVPVNLQELELAFGIGGFGSTRVQATDVLGELIVAGQFAGVIPADGHCIPDFLLSEKPSESVVYVTAALGLSGKPFGLLEVKSEQAFTVADLVKDIFFLGNEIFKTSSPILGLVIIAETPELVGSHFETLKDIVATGRPVKNVRDATAALIIAVAADESSLQSCSDPAVSRFIEQINRYPVAQGRYFHGHGVTLTTFEPEEFQLDPGESIRTLAKLENLQGVSHIEPNTLLVNPRVWLYVPRTVRPGAEKRLKIEIEEETDFPDELDIITRRIYTDADRVILTPLYGGFMSRTYYATSYDSEGRRMLPTVLKTGSLDLTRREEEAYHNHVEKFILNNSTTIMGTASCGDWAGLRYNFVGITGPNTRLTWLENHYINLPLEELLPLFDTIYTSILKPWYGQPKLETLRPYVEHNPFRLFPNILEDAEKELRIASDMPTLDCPELGLELPNPFYFLKYEYPQRMGNQQPWYKSVIHGDLNMKNVLLDEHENVYIIDFSETRVSDIVSDFARLEPIVKFQMTRLESENDLRELVEFEAGLAKASSLCETPPLHYRGSDVMVKKAYGIIGRLRNYADTVTLFETDLVPYLLAMLEWTFPVVSYVGFPLLRKRLAVYSAGFICQKILELEKAQKV